MATKEACRCEVHRSQPDTSPLKCQGHGEGCPCWEELQNERSNH